MNGDIRANGYCLEPTGEVGALMHNFLYRHFGVEAGEDYEGRWKRWNIRDIGDLSKIIRHFGAP